MPSLLVFIFDDVVAARGEEFRIPGLEVTVFAHADDAVDRCLRGDVGPDVVFMDFALGAERTTGVQAVAALRAAGYRGRIVAISSDPAANARMVEAGASGRLDSKAHLRPYLRHLGEQRERGDGG